VTITIFLKKYLFPWKVNILIKMSSFSIFSGITCYLFLFSTKEILCGKGSIIFFFAYFCVKFVFMMFYETKILKALLQYQRCFDFSCNA
jgi:hypothetical protein